MLGWFPYNLLGSVRVLEFQGMRLQLIVVAPFLEECQAPQTEYLQS
jgi:hypothetical protein